MSMEITDGSIWYMVKGKQYTSALSDGGTN